MDLIAVAFRIAGGRRFDGRMIAPDIPQLQGFFRAIERMGWEVDRTTLLRTEQLNRLREVCASAGDQEVCVVSGRSDFINAARQVRNVRVVTDI